jgi:peptidoglycan hydrolase CwlO-like protein|tara:strand:- start:109 stop:306 length:198 start_codon:yes stop_codon:yes gene_type:complete
MEFTNSDIESILSKMMEQEKRMEEMNKEIKRLLVKIENNEDEIMLLKRTNSDVITAIVALQREVL